jgi:hypothetical protein
MTACRRFTRPLLIRRELPSGSLVMIIPSIFLSTYYHA